MRHTTRPPLRTVTSRVAEATPTPTHTRRVSERRSPSTRTLQVGFLVVLLVCAAQVAYWVVDEWRYTALMTDRLHDAYATAGAPQAALDVLRGERTRRLTRFAWEGGFFLAVILSAMAVVFRALRQDAELRRRQEQFLAAVSHEFRTPLASLRISVETLALRDPGAGLRAELVRRITVELSRLDRMVANALDMARLQAGGAPVPERIALANMLEEVTADLEDFATECGVRIVREVPPQLDVFADRDGLRMVLRNLLHNALKASPRSGAVTASARRDGDLVVLTVRDEGVGFPSKERKRLFEQFYRLQDSARGRMQGTGLGLYIVARHMRLAGGSAWADSAGPGRGATFTVEWPAPREAR
jgi:signal transduction histidine kinase